MADANGQDQVGLTTKWFGLNLSGKDAGFIFLFIAILALTGLLFWTNKQRSEETAAIQCMIKLNLFVNQQPRTEPLDWSKLPVDLYTCVPRFLYERGLPRQ